MIRRQWKRLWAVCLVGLALSVGEEATSQEQVLGQVRMSDGLPVAGAQVLLFDLADLRRGAVAQATTDAFGQFALPLAGFDRLSPQWSGSGLPAGFVLGPNYPNPFNPSTVIPYELASSGYVRLDVFNLLGQRVATLVDGTQAAGAHRAQWDGTDAAGQAAAGGVYVYRLVVDGAQQTGRMVLVDGQAGVAMGGGAVQARRPAAVSGSAYGLVVVGAGMMPYVDPAFRVDAGQASGELVVEGASGLPRMKVASGGWLGDVNNDGQVDVSDALLVMMYLLLLDVSALDLDALDWRERLEVVFFLERYASLASAHLDLVALGDVDRDGDVDFDDVQFMLTYSIDPSDPTLPEGIGLPEGEWVASLPDMAFVWIEPGVFQMGSPSSERGRDSDEGPVHEVEISQGFYLGKYEVTQGQWEAVMGETPWSGRSYVVEDSSHPAVYISWHNVQRFVAKLNDAAGSSVYRLPTEAEWEYACRAGSRTRWSFGDDESELTAYAWYRDNAWNVGEDYAHAVGTKLPNAWGLYDMHGNVWEWVQDWWDSDYYNSSPRVDPPGPTFGSFRVLRGGSVINAAQAVRSAIRSFSSPDDRVGDFGVRLLRIGNP